MKKTILTVMLFALGSMTLSSCRKEGCTDKTAVNYSSDAKKDDGTCKYEGSVVFYYDQAMSETMQSGGSTSLTYYFDGVVVGSQATSTFWNGIPTCGQNGSVTVTKSLGSVKSKSFAYKIVDQNGFVGWEGNITLDANSCLKFHLQ